MNEQNTNGGDKLFFSAFRASPVGIALEDLEGRPLFVNPALCSMLGFTEDEMRRKHCVEFSPAEDAEKDWALFAQLRAGTIDRYQIEKRFFRRDGSLIWGRLSISLTRSGGNRYVIATVEELSKERAAQENLAGRLIQAQEEERARIARELHDDIHQQLVLLSINLDQVQQSLPREAGEVSQKLSEAREQLVNVSKDIHSLSHRLHSAKLEYLGFPAAAASLCRDVSRQHKVKIAFHSEVVSNELPNQTALCLYRVLQEALHNATKHSGSTHVEVSLRSESHEIKLIVRDWGIGFDPAGNRKGPGLGLASMKERLSLINGELSIESQPECGTTICARVSRKQASEGIP
jgi:PAS domain S-box-containing protein